MSNDKFWFPLDSVIFFALGGLLTALGIKWAGYSIHNPWDYLVAAACALGAVLSLTVSITYARKTWKAYHA